MQIGANLVAKSSPDGYIATPEVGLVRDQSHFPKKNEVQFNSRALPHLKHQLPPQMPPLAHPVRSLRIRQRISGDLRQLHRA